MVSPSSPIGGSPIQPTPPVPPFPNTPANLVGILEQNAELKGIIQAAPADVQDALRDQIDQLGNAITAYSRTGDVSQLTAAQTADSNILNLDRDTELEIQDVLGDGNFLDPNLFNQVFHTRG